MFTKNINFSNFKFKSNLSKKKNLLKKINNKNIFIELPLLKSLTKEYQMGYDRSLIKSLKNNIPDFKSKNQLPPFWPNGRLGILLLIEFCVYKLYKYG